MATRLPANIDLTENRIFGRTEWSSAGRIRLSPRPHYINNYLSYDEYRAISRYEKIFGVKSHECRRFELFPWPWAHDPIYNSVHRMGHGKVLCERCGKEIRLPWHNNGGLCPECSNAIMTYEDMGRFPWSERETLPPDRQSGGTEESHPIFSLR